MGMKRLLTGCVLVLMLVVRTGFGADLSDPKKTIQSWYDAGKAGDAAGLKACFVPAPDDAAYFAAVCDQIAALQKALALAEKKLGKSAVEAIDNDRLNHRLDEEHLKLVLAGTVTITGDTAVLISKPDSLQAKFISEIKTPFRKVGDEWKIDGCGPYKPGSAAMREALTSAYTLAAKRYQQLAADLAADKFKSVKALEKAMEESEN